MESYTSFLCWKNQYCQNDYTTQINLQIQCNAYQFTNTIFHRIITKKFTICVEKRSQIAKAILREKSRAGGIRLPDFRLYYKATVIKTVWYCYKKQKYKSMEQDSKSRGKPRHLQSPNWWQRNIQWRKDSLFNKWCLENWTARCKGM